MNLTAIACMSANRVIGTGKGIPWHHPADLRFFKGKTLGHTVIMGRKTWESLPSRPLPNRRNIVLSRCLLAPPGVEVACSLRHLQLILKQEHAFVIGGAEVYRLLLPWTTEVLLTVLDRRVEGSVLMPEFEDRFHEPEIIDRTPGVAEWRRYVRKPTNL